MKTKCGLVCLLTVLALPLFGARTPAMVALDWAKAEGLAEQGRRKEAIAVFESLLKDAPDDGGINFSYAYQLYLESLATGKDRTTERKLRQKARLHLRKAADAGLTNPLIQHLLNEIKEDGRIEKKVYSRVQKADAAMHRGEVAFQQRAFDKARQAYREALQFDPSLAEAALYLGDTFYLEKRHADAQAWFIKAGEIDPNLEQAYRFRGDSLWAEGRKIEAIAQYVESVIAWPYHGMGWSMLQDRAASIGRMRPIATPNLPQANITVNGDEIHLDLLGVVNALTLSYGLGRANWLEQRQKTAGASQKPYRFTLEEECVGLRMLIQVTRELLESEKNDETQMPPAIVASVQKLAEIDADGLLEAHVLLTRANRDLARDYPAYRDQHREKLRLYLHKYVVRLD